MIAQEVSAAWLRDITRDAGHGALLDELTIKALMFIPLVARGNTLGALTLLMTEPDRRNTQIDASLAVDFANRCALAIDNALLYSRAQKAVEAREEILSLVSHNLRTPLTSIRAGLGLVEMRTAERLDEDSKQLIANARRGADTLGILVNDLLAFTQLDTGALQLTMELQDVRFAITGAVSVVSPLLTRKDQEVRVELKEPLLANIDRRWLEQAFINLLDNVHRHTPEGTKIAIVGCTVHDNIIITFADNGPGVLAAEQEAVFQKFHRGTGSKSQSGLGIGLSLVRSIVELHGGHVTLRPTPKGGATFEVTLPCHLYGKSYAESSDS